MKIGHIIFYVNNLRQSTQFYEKLGFTIAQNHGKFISYNTDDNNQFFSIMEFPNSKRKPGMQVCLIYKKNLNGFFEKCKLLGIPIEQELKDLGFGETFAVVDPDGNKIEFQEYPKEED